jgi:hypothetical protein
MEGGGDEDCPPLGWGNQGRRGTGDISSELYLAPHLCQSFPSIPCQTLLPMAGSRAPEVGKPHCP